MSNPRWVALESNPEMFANWSSEMGLDESAYSFSDIYGLDQELLAFVPQPVLAILLLFPITQAYEDHRAKQDQERAIGFGQDLLFFKQTIGNACGTMGLLHALSNAGLDIPSGSPLARLIAACRPLSPLERGKYLETSKELESAHNSSTGGQTAAPSPDQDIDLHFAAFVAHDGHLVELDGRKAGPIDRGVIENDLLTSVAGAVRELMAMSGDSVNFSLVALSANAN